MACVELKGTGDEIARVLAPITDLSLPSVASQRYVGAVLNMPVACYILNYRN
jgi:hypothetical protein